MAVSTRIIRRRIKSIQNTKKITKAMELVSASKMRKAVNAVVATRPYATLAWETINEVAKFTDPSLHLLLAKRGAVRKILVILITSNRGLCGGFNAQILKQVLGFRFQVSGQECDFIAVGKKGQDAARRLKWNIVAAFADLSVAPAITDIQPIAALAINDFKSGVYDKVVLAYTDFVSSLKQIPRVKELLPLSRIEGLGNLKDIAEKTQLTSTQQYNHEYIFEPSPTQVLDMMLPRLVEAQIYQAILESGASEHSARMVAMKNATESAGD
ncbi:ATP synthase F1 subunit gamma [Candidatus Peregrinibacteria bacterium]|nr:ATP synthase F1 subunit gamma [Candidatus Peregrinibacteria bacterium]